VQGRHPGPIAATLTPPRRRKYGATVNAPVMNHLRESRLVRWVPMAFSSEGGNRSRQEHVSHQRLPPPVPELPMFSVYVPLESALKKQPDADLGALPDNAVWIDLLNPTMEEDRAVGRRGG